MEDGTSGPKGDPEQLQYVALEDEPEVENTEHQSMDENILEPSEEDKRKRDCNAWSCFRNYFTIINFACLTVAYFKGGALDCETCLEKIIHSADCLKNRVT